MPKKTRVSRSYPYRRRVALLPSIEGLEERVVLSITSPVPDATLASPSQRQTLDDLPLIQRYAFSEAIGADRAGYHAVAIRDGFELANPANGYSAIIDHTGLTLRAGADTWTLDVESFGRGEAQHPVGPATISAESNRVTYDHTAIASWYVNGPLGLQQGFAVAERPDLSPGIPLSVVVDLAGTLRATVRPGGDDLTLSRPDGTSSLTFGGLLAYDAHGSILDAHFQVRPDGGEQDLVFVVDDSQAVYPLTIDPVLQVAKLTAPDALGQDRFGYSVAVDGDTIVVGAHGDDIGTHVDQGSAYVFTKPTEGWGSASPLVAKLTASDGEAGDAFGIAVAVSGDTVVVGAYLDDIGSFVSQGSAYIFSRPLDGWVTTGDFTKKLVAFDAHPRDSFGNAVAIDGDTIVIGASFADPPTALDTDAGAAYVFSRPAEGWGATSIPVAKLGTILLKGVPFGGSGSKFGYSVAVDGDTVVIGAPLAGYSTPTGFRASRGAAYIYEKPEGGWTSTAVFTSILTASDAERLDWFGNSVSISDSTIAVSAVNDLHPQPIFGVGSVYIFTRPAPGWSSAVEDLKLIAPSGREGNTFGFSVSVSGDTIVVGDDAYSISQGGSWIENRGIAYLFSRPASGWAEGNPPVSIIVEADGGANHRFGRSVSVSGDTIIIGAPNDGTPADPLRGSAYVFVNERSSTPVITRNPADQSVLPGLTATFTAEAEGSPIPAVQWQFSFDGLSWTDIGEASSETYSFAATPSDNGKLYRAVFTNSAGSVATTPATLNVVRAAVVDTEIGWGNQFNQLADAPGGRLLPAGRNISIPWLNIDRIMVTLDRPVPSLDALEVSVIGTAAGSYGPVGISGGGSRWTITLSRPIGDADRVSVLLGNTQIASYSRLLDVLPGDVNDDGVVNSQDAVLVRNVAFNIRPVTLLLVFLDINGDGLVNVNDFNLVRGRNGKKLPPLR